MQPGQAFVVTCRPKQARRTAYQIRSSVAYYQSKHPGTKFRVTQGDGIIAVERVS